MLIYNSDSFSVKYDGQQDWLHLACWQKLQADEFKEGLVSALNYAEQMQLKRWLLDLREIGCLNEQEEAWLQSYFYPHLMSVLGTNNFVAVVLSEKCYNALLLEAGKFGLKSYNSFIIMNTFCHLEEAVDWLKKDTDSLIRC